MTFTGDEHIIYDGMPTGYTLQDFWYWSTQDLTSSYTYRTFCTFIVAVALGIDPALQQPNERYDLTLSLADTHLCNDIHITINRFSRSYSDICIFCEYIGQVDSTPTILDNWSFYIVSASSGFPMHIYRTDFSGIHNAIYRCIEHSM